MNEIKCPQCGTVFTIDENSYAEIVKQVRTKEFNLELKQQRDTAVKLAEAEKDKLIARLQAEMEQLRTGRDLAVREAVDQVRKEAAAKENLITALQSELQNKAQLFETQKELAVRSAVKAQEEQQHEQEKRILALQAQIGSLESASALKEKQLIEDRDRLLKIKDDEIAYYKDLKARMSTKMVGETLEQHCEIEFDKARSIGFQTASFEKDNDAKTGSKGDYIFRDYDESGNEYISIMFEMKNEMDETATKHKNKDFFKKLDHDRNEKGCEYAVLVSLLETDDEYYNTGIVDVSHYYEKMYVIRPQFFIPFITLLRNAARKSLGYRQELAQIKSQNIDVEMFNQHLIDFKERFGRNYDLASRQFGEAIEEIDKSISHLEKIKKNLQSSLNNLRLANDKASDLTVKRLTRGNKTMTEKFLEAGISTE